jgi:hypothetical protein
MTSPTDKPYNPKIPEKIFDSLAEGQPELLNNFFQLYEGFLVNHVPLDAPLGAGNHTFVQLLEQGNAQQTGISEISVYVKEAPGTTDQIFLRYSGNGQEFQFSCYQVYGLTQAPGVLLPFFTFLPGRILIYFGVINPAATGNVINLYPPIATNIMGMTFTPSVPTIPSSFKPLITFTKDDNGFFSKVNLSPAITGATLPAQFYYIVMANI